MPDIPLIASIGAKKGPQRWDWEYLKQVIGKEGAANAAAVALSSWLYFGSGAGTSGM